MSEGPQVRRRTEWLHKHLAGRKVVRSQSSRSDLRAESLTGRRVERVSCKGKHIFIECEGGIFVHNHLLMRGTWKKLDGQQLFLPPDTWLALYVGSYTICNFGGQKLRLIDQTEVERQLSSLGPDAMGDPFPKEEIAKALRSVRLPVAEALLDQSLVAGIGNIAKSEILFAAKLDPRLPACDLDEPIMNRLLDVMPRVLWASYHNGGRWVCQVYRHTGRNCPDCGVPIRSIAQPPSKRATYYCPRCQGVGEW